MLREHYKPGQLSIDADSEVPTHSRFGATSKKQRQRQNDSSSMQTHRNYDWLPCGQLSAFAYHTKEHDTARVNANKGAEADTNQNLKEDTDALRQAVSECM